MIQHFKLDSAQRWIVVAALLLAALGLHGMALCEGITTLTNPTTAFAYWSRLPGGRLLWVRLPQR